MAEKDTQGPINGADRNLVAKMVDLQVLRTIDHYRALQFWQRLLAGDTDPEEIAQGLCQALSHGRYIEKPGPGPVNYITINVPGSADPEALARTLAEVLGSPR